jgi:hypothetical protein
MRALGGSPQDPLFDPNVLERGLLLALGWNLREASAARPALAARVEEACQFVGKKFAGLVLNP